MEKDMDFAIILLEIETGEREGDIEGELISQNEW